MPIVENTYLKVESTEMSKTTKTGYSLVAA